MQDVADAITNAVSESLKMVADFLPNLISAIFIFLVGVIISVIARNLLVRLLNAVKLEKNLANTGIPDSLRKTDSNLSLTKLLGELVRWAVILVFLIPAFNQLGLEEVNVVIKALLAYIPNVLVAVIIVTVGVVFAKIARDFVSAAASSLGPQTARTVGQIARWSIIIFSLLAALAQLGVAQDLIKILFTGFVAMLALAGGLAFGLGGKDTAEMTLKKVREELEEKK